MSSLWTYLQSENHHASSWRARCCGPSQEEGVSCTSAERTLDALFESHTSMVACDHAAKKAQLSHLPWRNWLVRSTVSYEFAVEEEGTRGVVVDKKVQKEALPDRLELSTSR
jgi:hypothetical protein